MIKSRKQEITKYKSPEELLKEKLLELFEWYEKEKLKEQKLKTINF